MSSITENQPSQLPLSPKIVKQMEKEIAKEEKADESRVKHILDELSSVEKSRAKAEKAVQKAEGVVNKAEKKELAAGKAANTAVHKQEIAVSDKNNAVKDAELKKQHELNLQREIDAKKEAADAAIKNQQIHQQARESKLAELRGESILGPPTTDASAPNF
ncbi:hypothetical protein H0H81_011915 [Sphagnurus paluster]|uniref:Uncharacterized protein n=1 Tax=Sphagnurus paluster TaxID=117069 RepID=A0A9P7FWV0_9AGAR|nr:hypothetical protein H0H81_011915 [Sphagnurus paluster]